MPDAEHMKLVEPDTNKYLGVIQDSQIKTAVMKEKIEEEYFSRVRKLPKSMLYVTHVIIGINQCALGAVRYSSRVVEWTWGNLSRTDVKTRVILAGNGCLHPRTNVARLYLKRKTWGRGTNFS